MLTETTILILERVMIPTMIPTMMENQERRKTRRLKSLRNNASVAELEDALVLGTSSTEWGFESLQGYQQGVCYA
jgi:hypothetical protein